MMTEPPCFPPCAVLPRRSSAHSCFGVICPWLSQKVSSLRSFDTYGRILASKSRRISKRLGDKGGSCFDGNGFGTLSRLRFFVVGSMAWFVAVNGGVDWRGLKCLRPYFRALLDRLPI